jgi:hypothetical protein
MWPLPISRHGVASGWWQSWWIWLDGNQRSAAVTVAPKRALLYANCGFTNPIAAAETTGETPAGPILRFNGGHIEVFDHEVAIAARQLGGELMGGFPP